MYPAVGMLVPLCVHQEPVPMFEVSGVDNSNNPIAANLFVVGSITGSAYGFTASVGVQMCLVNGEDTSQCFPTTPDLLFQQSGWLDAYCLLATCVASGDRSCS